MDAKVTPQCLLQILSILKSHYATTRDTCLTKDIFTKKLNTQFIFRHFVPIIVHLRMKHQFYCHYESIFRILVFKNKIFDTKIITVCFTDANIQLLYDFMAAILNFYSLKLIQRALCQCLLQILSIFKITLCSHLLNRRHFH